MRYIEPNKDKIAKGLLESKSLMHMPGWESVMGLQFENLVTHNRKIIWKLLNLSPEEIIMDGPFFQNSTTKQPGCQIDYMIQTRFQSLFLCEIKFSKNPIGLKVIKEMETKWESVK